jgi:transcription initiation factor TFIIF subunit beta
MADSSVKTNPTNTTVPNAICPLDVAKADTGVWLVKVPKYLAKKWNEAAENSEVGVIRITQSKSSAPRPKQEVVFHLNETLARSSKPGEKEEKVPTEHKFVMTPLGSQAVYILKQPEVDSKDNLSIIGKVMQRAECIPQQNDFNYMNLKREEAKKFIEPKRQIQMANVFMQKTHFLPRSTPTSFKTNQVQAKKDVPKRLRKDKEKVLDILFNAFQKHQFYTIKDLVKLTNQPPAYLKDILHEICRYNSKGSHKNTWELKEEYKQGEQGTSNEVIKKTALEKVSSENGSKTNDKGDDFMDDDDDDDDDFDDDDMDDME